MRIEVHVGGEEPVVFPLNKKTIYIGSAESSHIRIPSAQGISRKHAQINIEDDKFYITDLGSTNGTFINEDRMAPGVKAEFTAFFPVRLGASVYLSLIGEDYPGITPVRELNQVVGTPSLSESTATKKMSIAEIKKTGLHTPVSSSSKLRPKVVRPRAKPVSKARKISDSSRMRATVLLTLGALGVVFGYKYYLNPVYDELNVAATPTAETPPPLQEIQPAPAAPEVTQIPAAEIPKMEEFQDGLHELRCTTTLEKKICDLIPDSRESFNGVTESIGRVMIYVQEVPWYEMSLKIQPGYQAGLEERTKINFLLFVKSLPAFEWKEIEKNVYVIFYRNINSRPAVSSVLGLSSKGMALIAGNVPDLNKVPLGNRGPLPALTRHLTVIQKTSEHSPAAVSVNVSELISE